MVQHLALRLYQGDEGFADFGPLLLVLLLHASETSLPPSFL